IRIMLLSRWPYPPGRERATLSRCLTSSGVRYSRGRTVALVGRRGVIVRFSMVGPPFAFSRKPLFLMGPVYPIVRISAKSCPFYVHQARSTDELLRRAWRTRATPVAPGA